MAGQQQIPRAAAAAGRDGGRRGETVKTTGPLFIVGMPRSGTKLLRGLLNRHPRIGVPRNESEFLPWLAHRFDRFGDLRPRALRRLLCRDAAPQLFPLSERAGPADRRRPLARGVRRILRGRRVRGADANEVDAPIGSERIWGDKSPSYIDDLPLLKSLYPAAKAIHIVRDVRDYCLSIHKAWGKNMARAAQRWADDVRGAYRRPRPRRRLPPLRYEDLLARTEAELRRVCEFLAVQFDDAMLTLERSSENLGDARGARAVLADNSGKFHHAMPPKTLARVEELAGPVLLGAATSSPCRAPHGACRPSSCASRSSGRRAPGARRPQRLGFRRTAPFHLRSFATTRG